MEDSPTPAQVPGPSPVAREADRCPAFAPLRLVNPAGGLVVRLTRPDMLIGRHRDADVRLPLADVSRRHCRFVFAEGSWQVFDLKSLNGVYLNGERVQQAVLRHRDVLSLGGYSFQVELGRDAASGEETADGPPSSGAVLKGIAEALPQPGAEAGYEKRRAS